MSEFGENIHPAKVNRYVALIEADSILFEKGVSPIEFHKPKDLQVVVEDCGEESGVGRTF